MAGAPRDHLRTVRRRGPACTRDLTERLRVVSPSLDVLCSPGHTDDGYGFLLSNRAFTGDTRLIRGTGRADFQAGDPAIHRKDRCVPRAIPS
jgi:glyoxylase-like metal-dependent hydrolase (beta-lactamase superfamily II)